MSLFDAVGIYMICRTIECAVRAWLEHKRKMDEWENKHGPFHN